MKKTLVLVAVVVAVHCLAIAALFLMQGCKTTKKITRPSPTTVMPPLTAPAVAPATVEPSPVIKKDLKGGEVIEYVVKSGDSLGLIAKRHNVSKGELVELNKLADPNKIRIGQKLIIPKHGQAAIAPAPKAVETRSKEKKSEPAPTFAAEVNEYVVQAGDTLSKIAAKFNVKISALREVNKLLGDKLKAGQKLIIPSATKVESAPEPAPAPAAPETPAKPEAPAAPTSSSETTPASGTVSPGAAPASKDPGSGITHVVMPNEDLSSIAKLYAVRADDIVTANQLGTNRTVQAGQKIIIP